MGCDVAKSFYVADIKTNRTQPAPHSLISTEGIWHVKAKEKEERVPLAPNCQDPPGERPWPDHPLGAALRGRLPGPGVKNLEALAQAPLIPAGDPAPVPLGIVVKARARAKANPIILHHTYSIVST